MHAWPSAVPRTYIYSQTLSGTYGFGVVLTTNVARTAFANACLQACSSGPIHQKYFHLYIESVMRASSGVIRTPPALFQHSTNSAGVERSTLYCSASIFSFSSTAVLDGLACSTWFVTLTYSPVTESKKDCSPDAVPKLFTTDAQPCVKYTCSFANKIKKKT